VPSSIPRFALLISSANQTWQWKIEHDRCFQGVIMAKTSMNEIIAMFDYQGYHAKLRWVPVRFNPPMNLSKTEVYPCLPQCVNLLGKNEIAIRWCLHLKHCCGTDSMVSCSTVKNSHSLLPTCNSQLWLVKLQFFIDFIVKSCWIMSNPRVSW